MDLHLQVLDPHFPFNLAPYVLKSTRNMRGTISEGNNNFHVVAVYME